MSGSGRRTSTAPRSFILHGAPEHEADLYFATGFRAPDPILCLGIRGRRVMLVSDLELFRARRQATRVDRVLSLSKEMARLRRRLGRRSRKNALTGLDVAAELDINWNWTRFFAFSAGSDGVPGIAESLADVEHTKRDYVGRASERDFFYVLRGNGSGAGEEAFAGRDLK